MENSKHIKGLFNAEIITIIGEIVTLIGGVFTLSAGLNAAAGNEIEGLSTFAVVSLIVTLVGVVLCVIAGIMSLVEIVKLRKASQSFASAFYWVIITVVVSVLSGIFQNNATIQKVFGICVNLSNVFMIIFITQGCKELCNDAGVTSLVNKVSVFVVVAALVAVLGQILAMNGINESVCETVSDICKVIYSIMYLVVLSKSAKALKA